MIRGIVVIALLVWATSAPVAGQQATAPGDDTGPAAAAANEPPAPAEAETDTSGQAGEPAPPSPPEPAEPFRPRPFRPSEEIGADAHISFPTDI